MKKSPDDVHVVNRMALSRWLRQRPEVLDERRSHPLRRCAALSDLAHHDLKTGNAGLRSRARWQPKWQLWRGQRRFSADVSGRPQTPLCRGMCRVVHSSWSHMGRLEQLAPRPMIRARVDRSSVRLREHEAVVLPDVRCCKPLLQLRSAVLPHRLDERSRDPDCASPRRIPRQSQRLALAQSERECDGPPRAVSQARRCVQDAAWRAGGQRLDLDPTNACRVHERADVARDPPPLHGQPSRGWAAPRAPEGARSWRAQRGSESCARSGPVRPPDAPWCGRITA